MKSLTIWFHYTTNAFQTTLSNRLLAGVFLLGKLLRIGLFVGFLIYLFEGADSLAGYSRNQVIFFYLSFNLIDTLAQFLFREVYRFRPLIVSGDFDLILVKPLSPLVRVLLGGADVMDLMMLILLLSAVAWFGINFISGELFNWLKYGILVLDGLLMAAAFHILVLALGVRTTTVDHLIMVYRDLTSLLRIPVDVYIEPLRSLLTFGLLLGMIFTFPPRALMGLLSPGMMAMATLVAVSAVWLAYQVWRWSLRSYTSASS